MKKIQKFISVMLVLMTLFSLMPYSVSAASISHSHTENVTTYYVQKDDGWHKIDVCQICASYC